MSCRAVQKLNGVKSPNTELSPMQSPPRIRIVKSPYVIFLFNLLFPLSVGGPKMPYNDLRASEGRETRALNCKPITNIKEISELSNFSKTSGFRLHAVIGRLIYVC